MITLSNIQNRGFREIVSEGLPKTADNLLSTQKNILNRTYMERSGELNRLLSSKPYTVNVTDYGASMQINYIAKIRFLDMKRSPFGKVKKSYAPIYNKYIWGFLMGYTYSVLRQGLSGMVRRELTTVQLDIQI